MNLVASVDVESASFEVRLNPLARNRVGRRNGVLDDELWARPLYPQGDEHAWAAPDGLRHRSIAPYAAVGRPHRDSGRGSALEHCPVAECGAPRSCRSGTAADAPGPWIQRSLDSIDDVDDDLRVRAHRHDLPGSNGPSRTAHALRGAGQCLGPPLVGLTVADRAVPGWAALRVGAGSSPVAGRYGVDQNSAHRRLDRVHARRRSRYRALARLSADAAAGTSPCLKVRQIWNAAVVRQSPPRGDPGRLAQNPHDPTTLPPGASAGGVTVRCRCQRRRRALHQGRASSAPHSFAVRAGRAVQARCHRARPGQRRPDQRRLGQHRLARHGFGQQELGQQELAQQRLAQQRLVQQELVHGLAGRRVAYQN